MVGGEGGCLGDDWGEVGGGGSGIYGWSGIIVNPSVKRTVDLVFNIVFGFVVHFILSAFFGFIHIGRRVILVESFVGFEALGA